MIAAVSIGAVIGFTAAAVLSAVAVAAAVYVTRYDRRKTMR